MLKKLMFVLILGMIMIGSATAYARGQGDQGENDDSQDETTILCPPGGCIQ